MSENASKKNTVKIYEHDLPTYSENPSNESPDVKSESISPPINPC